MPRQQKSKPKLEPPLLDHPLIPAEQFHEKLKAIMSVSKSELDARMEQGRKDEPDKPKRGRKRKVA